MSNPPSELPDPDEIDDSFMAGESEETAYNFRELMDMLIDKKDIIITVPNEQVELLKKGLYARKGKDNYKLSKAGVKAGTDMLSFLVYPSPTAPEYASCVRVKLGARKSVTVINIEVPDDEL